MLQITNLVTQNDKSLLFKIVIEAKKQISFLESYNFLDKSFCNQFFQFRIMKLKQIKIMPC